MKRYAGLVAACTLVAVSTASAPAKSLHDIGNVRATMPVRLTFVMRERNRPALDALVDMQSDRNSPLYRHFLSASQLRDYYFPTRSTYEQTIVALRNAGFAIDRESPSRLLIDATAPAATVERYFRTRLRYVARSFQGARYEGTRPPTMPAVLADVAGIAGFDDLAKLEPVRSIRAATTHPSARPPLYGPDGGFGPRAVEDGFDFPITHDARLDGKNVTVTDLAPAGQDSGYTAFSDSLAIAPYLKYFGVRRNGPPTQFIGHEYTCCQIGDDPVVVQDTQATISTAPGATLQVDQLEGDTPTFSTLLDALDNLVYTNRTDIVSMMFSACEDNVGEDALLAGETFTAGAAEGITFVAVADGGANTCPGAATPVADFPADSPDVLAIAGADVSEAPSGAPK